MRMHSFQGPCTGAAKVPGKYAAPPARELARAVQGDQIVVAADMKCSDIDLGHRPPACLAHHLHATCGLEIDSNLGNFGHTFRTQKALGEIAAAAYDAGPASGAFDPYCAWDASGAFNAGASSPAAAGGADRPTRLA